MKRFLSCDWGTTSLRIRLFDVEEQRVIAVVSGADGIFATHDSWKRSGADPAQRVNHYRRILAEYISRLRVNEEVSSLTLIISGMASASIGMVPLPYADLPFSLNGEGLQVRRLEKEDGLNEILLISGVRSADDVMRGEETELIGLSELLNKSAHATGHGKDSAKPGETAGDYSAGILEGSVRGASSENSHQLYIFPGTHSKHITVTDNRVEKFRTYMTGEIFALLGEHSILRSAIHACEFGESGSARAFEMGVQESSKENILHQIFTIRARELFASARREENYYYLSGLLIGHELNELAAAQNGEIMLCSQGRLKTLYEQAIAILGHEKKTRTFSAETADLAVAVGQFKIFQNKS